MSDRFEDHRGVIQDLFDGQPIDAVTQITTVKDAVRGNHVHQHTTQWTYVLSGRLNMASRWAVRTTEKVVGPGEIVVHAPGVAHAWKALEDTVCLVFTKGPRAGDEYETDTIRLDEPLLS